MRFLLCNVRPASTTSTFRRSTIFSQHIRKYANIPKSKALVPLKPEEIQRLNWKLPAGAGVEGYLQAGEKDGKRWYEEPSPFRYNSLASFGIFGENDIRSEQTVKDKDIELLNAAVKSIFKQIKQVKNNALQQQLHANLKEIMIDTASGVVNPQFQEQYHDIGRIMYESTQQRLQILDQSIKQLKETNSAQFETVSFEKSSLLGGIANLDRDIVGSLNLNVDKIVEMVTTKDPNKMQKLYNELQQSFIDGNASSASENHMQKLPDWESTVNDEITKNRPPVLDIFPKLEDNLKTLEYLQHEIHKKIQEKGGVQFPAVQYLATMDGMRNLLKDRYATDRPLNVNDSLILERMQAMDPELFKDWWKGPEDALTRLLNKLSGKQQSQVASDQKKLAGEEVTPETKPNPLENYVISDEPMTVENLPPTAKDYEDYLDVYMQAPLVRPPDIRQPFNTRNLWYHLLDEAEGIKLLRKRYKRRWKRFRQNHPHSGYYQEDLLAKTYPDKLGFIVRTIHTDSTSLMKHFTPSHFTIFKIPGWKTPEHRHAEWNTYVREATPVLGWLPYRWVWLFWILFYLVFALIQLSLAFRDEIARRVNIPLYFLIYHSWRVSENFMFGGTIFPQPGMETELVHLLGKPIVADMSLLTAFTIMNKSIMITAPIYGRDRKAVATIEVNAKQRGLFKYDWTISPVVVDFEDGTRVIVEIPEEWALLTPERLNEWKTKAALGKPDDWSRQFDDPITDYLEGGDVIREWPNTSGYLAIPYGPKPPSAEQK